MPTNVRRLADQAGRHRFDAEGAVARTPASPVRYGPGAGELLPEQREVRLVNATNRPVGQGARLLNRPLSSPQALHFSNGVHK
jgi:hypothetical protein